MKDAWAGAIIDRIFLVKDETVEISNRILDLITQAVNSPAVAKEVVEQVFNDKNRLRQLFIELDRIEKGLRERFPDEEWPAYTPAAK